MTQQNFRVRNGLTIDGTTSGSSSFASTATGTDLTYVLPGAQGAANTALTNDGSGNLSWALPGGGGSTFGNVTVGIDTDQTISTTSGNLILQTAAGVNAGTMTLTAGANGNITLAPNGTGDIQLQADAVVVGTNSSSGIISSRGAYDLFLQTNDGTNSGSITLSQGVNGNITLAPNGTGTVIVSNDLAVNGGDITTTQTTASVFNTTATTVNISGAATTTNIGSKTGSSIINGTNRFTSPSTFGFLGGGTSPSRGLMQSNGNTGSAATARNSVVMRTFPTGAGGSARGNLIFETSRGTETTPSAVQNNDLFAETVGTGYATNGWITDYVASVPGQTYFFATENWANTGGPYPTAGTVTNAGTGYLVALQPTATNLSAASRINVLNINPQNFNQRSDQFTWANGKTGTTQTMLLDVNGNLTTTGNLTVNGTGTSTIGGNLTVNGTGTSTIGGDLRINGNDILSSGGTTAITLNGADVNAVGNLSTGAGSITANGAFDQGPMFTGNATLLDTNFQAGGTFGLTTAYKPSSGSATYTVPQNNWRIGGYKTNGYDNTAGTAGVLASQLSTKATENWVNGTNNGTAIELLANKKGQGWLTGHQPVASFSPDGSSIYSDNFNILNSNSSATYLFMDANVAAFTRPVEFPDYYASSINNTLATTGASGTGSVATLTFAAFATAPYAIGSPITVTGVTPVGYNGTYAVTACTTSSVSYANTTTGAQTVAGNVTIYGNLGQQICIRDSAVNAGKMAYWDTTNSRWAYIDTNLAV